MKRTMRNRPATTHSGKPEDGSYRATENPERLVRTAVYAPKGYVDPRDLPQPRPKPRPKPQRPLSALSARVAALHQNP